MDSSDDSDDSDDEKDPEKKEKKKAKKAEKAKNASAKDHSGGKPKKDAGLFAHTQFLRRQEQEALTLTSRKATPCPSHLHHLITTDHHFHIQSHSRPSDDGIYSHSPYRVTNAH